jgi:hypothetical protein
MQCLLLSLPERLPFAWVERTVQTMCDREKRCHLIVVSWDMILDIDKDMVFCWNVICDLRDEDDRIFATQWAYRGSF